MKAETQRMSIEEKRDRAIAQYKQVVGSEGEKLVSGSDDFTLIMWAPQTGKTPVTRMTGHQQLVVHICFSPDGRYLASASFDKKVKLWCGKTGNFLATLNGHVGSVYQVIFYAVFIKDCHCDESSFSDLCNKGCMGGRQ